MTIHEIAKISNALPDSGDISEAVGMPRPELYKQLANVAYRLANDDGFTAANIMLRLGLALGYLYGKQEATQHSFKELMDGEL